MPAPFHSLVFFFSTTGETNTHGNTILEVYCCAVPQCVCMLCVLGHQHDTACQQCQQPLLYVEFFSPNSATQTTPTQVVPSPCMLPLPPSPPDQQLISTLCMLPPPCMCMLLSLPTLPGCFSLSLATYLLAMLETMVSILLLSEDYTCAGRSMNS